MTQFKQGLLAGVAACAMACAICAAGCLALLPQEPERPTAKEEEPNDQLQLCLEAAESPGAPPGMAPWCWEHYKH